ncbi:MAG: S1 RNA-binding domain-containing protein [Hungatella sp.]|nr:S1 RNA-binding domain-containing protein [Hungatella sp.]
MSEELKKEEVLTQTENQEELQAAAEPSESMADYAGELEESYKAFDERRNQTYVPEESPDAEKWQELRQMQADKTVVKVKIKEIVKGGAVTYLNNMQAFIPASQLSLEYVEKLEEWTGKYIEAYVITVDPEKKRIVLSARELLKERRNEERQKKIASYKAGDIVEGVVDSLKDYGAFVNLEGGVSGLLHVSQISSQRIKHPSVVLKEGQQVKVKIRSVENGKISLTMKALEERQGEEEVSSHFEYKNSGEVSTGLGALLKGLKL